LELREGRLHVHRGSYASYLVARELAAAREAVAGQTKQALSAGARERGGNGRGTAGALAAVEAEIDVLERALVRTGDEVVRATAEAQWDRVRTLGRTRDEMQSKLDALLVRWESLAPAQ
jgi:hypothetical protein